MLSSDGRSALHFVRARLQSQMKLFGETKEFDNYGITEPQHAKLPEDYSNIERMLVQAMRTIPAPPGFQALIEEEYLDVGTWRQILEELDLVRHLAPAPAAGKTQLRML